VDRVRTDVEDSQAHGTTLVRAGVVPRMRVTEDVSGLADADVPASAADTMVT
jgi:hypothetical protein